MYAAGCACILTVQAYIIIFVYMCMHCTYVFNTMATYMHTYICILNIHVDTYIGTCIYLHDLRSYTVYVCSVYCLLFLGTFTCSITTPKLITNALDISCKLLETLRRISATITCTNCTYFQPITITGDSPIVVSDLIAGQYTIEITIADSTEINDTIVETIIVSDNDKFFNSTVVKTITESNKCTSSPTNGPVCASMYVHM